MTLTQCVMASLIDLKAVYEWAKDQAARMSAPAAGAEIVSGALGAP